MASAGSVASLSAGSLSGTSTGSAAGGRASGGRTMRARDAAAAAGGVVRGAALVGRIMIRSNSDDPVDPGRRGPSMYPATLRRRTSRACRSGTSTSSSVTGAPAIRSPLTTTAPPTRAHSARIAPTAAFRARSVTRPPLNCNATDCCAEADTATSTNAAIATRTRRTPLVYPLAGGPNAGEYGQ